MKLKGVDKQGNTVYLNNTCGDWGRHLFAFISLWGLVATFFGVLFIIASGIIYGDKMVQDCEQVAHFGTFKDNLGNCVNEFISVAQARIADQQMADAM